MLFGRRIALFLCLAAILLVAISPVAPSFLWAIVVPLFLFCAAVVTSPIDRDLENIRVPLSPVTSLLASRAPPNPVC